MRPGQVSQKHLTATRWVILPGNPMSTIHEQSPQSKAAAVPRRSDRHTGSLGPSMGEQRGGDSLALPAASTTAGLLAHGPVPILWTPR